MADDEVQTPAPVTTVAAIDTQEVELAPSPALVDAEALVRGLRQLQQRVPGFVQLSLREEQSMARAAYLDPEFLERGLHAAAVWPQTKNLLGMTAEELRHEAEEARRWDEVERELIALTKGIAAANLKRKHRLGNAILQLYGILKTSLHRDDAGAYSFLRPYFEEMKRAWNGRRKRKAKAAE
jgi:hypothetical protein